MPQILTFLKGLQHKFSKNEIAKSCELTLNSLRDNTLPLYQTAVEQFKLFKFSTPELRSFATNFRRMTGAGNDMFAEILRALQNGEKLLKAISEKSDTLFADQEATLALNYQKATYVQLVTTINFADDYARKFLDYAYVLETAKADPAQEVKNSLSPAQLQYVEQYFVPFCNSVRIMLMDVGHIEKQLTNLPDVIVTELSEQTLPQTLGAGQVDPLGMNALVLPISVGVKWNPFYLIGTAIAAFQVACYKASSEERELLQMRQLNLEKLHQKSPDPKLQQQIEYLNERVKKLNFEIHQKQQEWGL